MRTRRQVGWVLLIALAAACSDPFTVTAPEFSYTVSRDTGEDLTIEGTDASWGVTEFGTSTGFQSALRVQLYAGGGGDLGLPSPLLLIDSRDDRLSQDEPKRGTYSIVPLGDQFMVVSILTSSGSHTADRGSVVITESSKSGLKGSLDLHFPGFDLVGEFSAKNYSE